MKSLLATICVLAIIGMAAGIATVKADTEGTVTATVTIGEVSVTIVPTTFNYGSVPFSASKESFDVIDEAGNNNIKATVGTVQTDLDVRATSTAAWTLAATTDANQYIHKFATSTNGTTRPTGYVALTNDYGDTVLATNVSANGDIWLGLEIHTPTAGESAQQSAAVSVRATWSE